MGNWSAWGKAVRFEVSAQGAGAPNQHDGIRVRYVTGGAPPTCAPGRIEGALKEIPHASGHSLIIGANGSKIYNGWTRSAERDDRVDDCRERHNDGEGAKCVRHLRTSVAHAL